MTFVDLRIHKYMEGDTLYNGAIVQIRQVLGPQDSKLVQEVPAPVGEIGTRRVELEPGSYEFSALLPSGSVASSLIEVEESATPVPVTLHTDDSPHEWLAWQQWAGNAGSAELTQGLQSALARRSDNLRDCLDNVGAALWWVPAGAAKGPDPLWNNLQPALASLESGASIDPGSIVPVGATTKPIHLLRDPPYLSAKLPLGEHPGSGRAYLVVSNGKRSILCAMPWPWQQTDFNGEALVEAVIAIDEERIESPDQASATDELWSVRPAVRDRVMGGLISYFAAGEQATAHELLAPARSLLFGKMNNPLAAAAGAYILVGEWIRESATATGTAEWFQWVRNLREWFPWLPDGALLDGWLTLRRRDQEPRLAEARAALLEAEGRGIPLYTVGVRRLVDGLMLLAGEKLPGGAKDEKVIEAMARMRRLAWQVDPRQAFTCVRLWSG